MGDVAELAADVESPPFPTGRPVELGRRGTTFVREVEGPPDAPTVLLLHGWMASAGLNWFTVFGPLGRHFRVVAVDHRGHGRGIRSRRRFTLADCADDAAAVLDALGTGPAIVAGYSMGGPIAQLLWKRHPGRVAGLVLAATGHSFVYGGRERVVFTTAMAVGTGSSRLVRAATAGPRSILRRATGRGAVSDPASLPAWAMAELGRHDWTKILQAGHALGTYDARRWIGRIDVPTAVVVTTQDKAVQPNRQRALAYRIRGATVHTCEGGHTACASDVLAAPLVAACRDVAARVRAGTTEVA